MTRTSDSSAQLDTVDAQRFPDSQAALKAVDAGQAQWASIPPAEQAADASSPLPGVAIMVAMTTHAGACCIGFNVDGDAVEDLSVLMKCFQEGLDEVLAIAD
jgi:hypothetical protein